MRVSADQLGGSDHRFVVHAAHHRHELREDVPGRGWDPQKGTPQLTHSGTQMHFKLQTLRTAEKKKNTLAKQPAASTRPMFWSAPDTTISPQLVVALCEERSMAGWQIFHLPDFEVHQPPRGLFGGGTMFINA